jgi:hypothetical protein
MMRLLRAVAAREPAPSRLGTEPVSDLSAGGTDSEQWAAQVRGGGSVVPLYSELATLLDAGKLEDVAGTAVGDINTALRPDPAELKPGLNFVARLGSRGLTGYLVNGEFTGTLPTTRDGPEPKVALMLGPLAFDAGNKAAALGVLRHEMEHAFHDRLAANLLRRWRQDATAAKTPFAGWLEKQAMSAVDRARAPRRLHRRFPGRGAGRPGGRAPGLRERAQRGGTPMARRRQARPGRVHPAAEGAEDPPAGRTAEHVDRRPEGPQGGGAGLRGARRRGTALSRTDVRMAGAVRG